MTEVITLVRLWLSVGLTDGGPRRWSPAQGIPLGDYRSRPSGDDNLSGNGLGADAETGAESWW